MKIAIIGTGGAGGYFGAKLAQHGFDVGFLARGAQLDALQTKGLTVKSVLGDFQLDKVRASDKISELGKSDLIILGVKSWQVKEIRAELQSIIHADTMILPLQNGVSTIQELSEVIDSNNILGGLCKIISKIEAPGLIHHIGVTPLIVFGEPNKTISPRVEALKAVFDKAEIESIISPDIEAELWKKFILVCVGGLLALSKTSYGELRSLPETRPLMIELLEEILTLSKAIGIQIEADYMDKMLSFIDSFPYDSASSLARDIWAGYPSEIEYQNGAVVRLGKEYGVATPINRFVYDCILPMERKARG
jgi:2-dehydropantoate 2-reductase